jgi:hypothetical protein
VTKKVVSVFVRFHYAASPAAVIIMAGRKFNKIQMQAGRLVNDFLEKANKIICSAHVIPDEE